MKPIINRIVVIDSIFFMWYNYMEEGRLIMYCTNCGNKIEEDCYVCVNCGMILKSRSVDKKNNNNILGVVSTILGCMALILSFMLFFHDIRSVGMYTEVYERIFYTLDYALSAILMSSVTIIFALINKRSVYSNIGLFLSILSFFFIITEFIVVIIY